jgi:threonine dehydrogenase-like Zn-dependent dehydrogenase
MQGQRYGTLLAMCESGVLKPGKVVSRTVSLEEITGVFDAMADYDTTGIVVIDSHRFAA